MEPQFDIQKLDSHRLNQIHEWDRNFQQNINEFSTNRAEKISNIVLPKFEEQLQNPYLEVLSPRNHFVHRINLDLSTPDGYQSFTKLASDTPLEPFKKWIQLPANVFADEQMNKEYFEVTMNVIGDAVRKVLEQQLTPYLERKIDFKVTWTGLKSLQDPDHRNNVIGDLKFKYLALLDSVKYKKIQMHLVVELWPMRERVDHPKGLIENLSPKDHRVQYLKNKHRLERHLSKEDNYIKLAMLFILIGCVYTFYENSFSRLG